MKVRYSYLQQQFENCDDLWEKLKAFVPTGDCEGERDRPTEARLGMDLRKHGLIVEKSLTEWMGLWGIPF